MAPQTSQEEPVPRDEGAPPQKPSPAGRDQPAKAGELPPEAKEAVDRATSWNGREPDEGA